MLAGDALGNQLSPELLDPTICADPSNPTTCGKPDRTYGELMKLMPSGLRGVIFAALIAAIVSSLASMMNSISTIFTMDIYKDLRSDQSQQHYVKIGRISAFTAIVIALIAAQPFQQGFESGFQTVQEYTGFIAPGVVGVFLLGFFWSRANTAGAFALLIGSIVLNIILKVAAPDIPFVIRVWIVFLTCMLLGVIVTLMTSPPREDQVLPVSDVSFATTMGFKIASALIVAALIGIYLVFW
jgi:SSS family solute:Na+ symporter